MERRQFIYHTDLQSMMGFVGLVAEITVDDINHTIRVHDGITKGGWPLARADMSNVDITKIKQILNGQITSNMIVFDNKGTAYVSQSGNDTNDGFSPWTPKASLQSAIALGVPYIEILDSGSYQLGGTVNCTINGSSASIQLSSTVNQLSGSINVNIIQTNGFQFTSNVLTSVTANELNAIDRPLINCINNQSVYANIKSLSNEYGVYSNIKAQSQILNPPKFEIKSVINVNQFDTDLSLNGENVDLKKHTYLGYLLEHNLIPNGSYTFTNITTNTANKPLSMNASSLASLYSAPKTSIVLTSSSPWTNDSKSVACVAVDVNLDNANSYKVLVDGVVQEADGTYGSSNGHTCTRLILVKPKGVVTVTGSYRSLTSSVSYSSALGLNELLTFADTGV